MEYSAGMVSRPFWYQEARRTAAYMLEGKDKQAVKQIVLSDNLYQAPTEYRASQIFNAVYTRLNGLDRELLSYLVQSGVATSKNIVLFAIMRTDRLFREFMLEVVREKLRLGDPTLKDRDLAAFFDFKRTQSGTVGAWTEETVQRLKQCYARILYEAGLTDSSGGERRLQPAVLEPRVAEHVRNGPMSVYVQAVMGE